MVVLVVDDENLIRQSIFRCLANMGIDSIILAENGLEGLERCKTAAPDIVIADIRMPGMDGIELLEAARGIKSESLFIFISGYDLFEYAQKAISLGAFAYLLKPVNESTLRETVSKAISRITDRAQKNKEIQTISSRYEKNVELTRRLFISEVLEKQSLSLSYISEKMKELDFSFLHESYLIILASPSMRTAGKPDLCDSMRIDVESAAVLLLENIGIVYPFGVDWDFGFLVNLSAEDSAQPRSRLRAICEEIKAKIEQATGLPSAVAAGTNAANFSSIRSSCETAKRELSLSLLSGMVQVSPEICTGSTAAHGNPMGQGIESELQHCFEQNDRGVARQLIHRHYAEAGAENGLQQDSISRLNFRLLIAIYKAVSEFNLNPKLILGDEFSLYRQVNAMQNIEAVERWFAEKTDICMDEISSSIGKERKTQIELARDFVRKHYQEYLTLEIVAQSVHLNPSYLSRRFKEESGQNFIDYVLDYRLKKARELLTEGVYKANEVCKMVGFNDERYFYKVFKKRIGLTPSEYRKKS